MGEHRNKPPPPPRPNSHLQPKFDVALGCDLHTAVVPKENYFIIDPVVRVEEREGGRVAITPDGAEHPVPEASQVVLSTETNDECFDVVVVLRVTYTKGSVVFVGNRLPQAQIGVAELARMPLAKVKAMAEALISGKLQPGAVPTVQ
jgi:hypothetical protein